MSSRSWPSQVRSGFRKVKNHMRRVGLYRTRTLLRTLKYRYVHGHHVGGAFDLLSIDPSNVDHYLSPRFGPRSYVFDIKGGDWDETRPRPIEEYDMYRAFERHFTDGISWTQTEFYERITDEIDQGKTKWGCTSEDEFYEVCGEFDSLHDSIVEHGFLSMKELHDRGLDTTKPIHAHEVCVVIGRDGTLYSDEGRHRLFIAKVLDFDQIPARVLVRHTEWQRIRDQAAAKGSPPSEYTSHPDLKDIR